MANTELDKMVDFFRMVSFFFLLVHFYVWCKPLFVQIGLTHPMVDDLFLVFFKPIGFYNGPLVSKMVVALMVGISCLGSSGKKKPDVDIKIAISILAVGTIIFLISVDYR